MEASLKDKQEYEWLREFKRIHGAKLRRRYGAHSIGIGRKRTGGKKTGNLALIFYVERKMPAELLDTESIPSEISFTPSNSDKQVSLKTDVVESAQAVFED